MRERHPVLQQLHHLWARCQHHLCVQEARQARVKATRRHHRLCVLGVRHPRVRPLGEAYDVIDLGGVPLEEEEEEAHEVDEAV